MTYRTQHIVTLMAWTDYGEKIQSTKAKGKANGVESWGNQAQASKTPLALWSLQTYLISPAGNCDSTSRSNNQGSS